MSKWTMIRRDDYKHYRNQAESGIVFCTFTVLDFVHAFANERIASLMAASLLDDCMAYRANLFAFVVMPHHVHFLAALPEGKTVSWLIARIKANSSFRIRPWLSAKTADELKAQQGLNQRSFWQRSFRSVQIETREMMAQKMDYIHMNPVKAGLAPSPELYSWSSCGLILEGLASADAGLRIDRNMASRFAPEEMLSIRRRVS
jgi:REP element-mobilizing transposase RayT